MKGYKYTKIFYKIIHYSYKIILLKGQYLCGRGNTGSCQMLYAYHVHLDHEEPCNTIQVTKLQNWNNVDNLEKDKVEIQT